MITDNGREAINALVASQNALALLPYDRYDVYTLEGFHIAPFQIQRVNLQSFIIFNAVQFRD